MSQRIVKVPHVGPFKAFEFEQSVRAKKGSKQDRIHVMGYDGKKGKDPYAVAASRMQFSTDAEAKLGWWDRKFCVLHKEDDVWYKININSFKKRINPVNPLVIEKSTGVCSNLKEVLPVSNTLPVIVNFKEMFVCKNRRSGMSFSFQKSREPVRNDNPALADLLDYCENNESKIFSSLQSLSLSLNLSQFKIRIDPAGDRAKITVTLPYSLLNGPYKLNWLKEHEYIHTKWGQCEWAEFNFLSRGIDPNISDDKNFAFLMDDLTKTFKPWYESAKTIAEYGETDVLSQLILDSAPWKEFQLKDKFQPNFDESCFWLSVSLDDNHDVKMNLRFYLRFGRNSSCNLPMEDMVFSSKPSFDVLFDSWKEQFPLHLQQFLDEEAYDFRSAQDWAYRPFGVPFQPNCINFEFKELDELLELNGEMTALETEQKYAELKELLNKKVLAELRKCHPDKVLLLGLDPVATAERTQKLNDLRKKANDYLDSKI